MHDRYATILPPPEDDLPLPPVADDTRPTVPAPTDAASVDAAMYNAERRALFATLHALARDNAELSRNVTDCQRRNGELLQRCREAEAERDDAAEQCASCERKLKNSLNTYPRVRQRADAAERERDDALANAARLRHALDEAECQREQLRESRDKWRQRARADMVELRRAATRWETLAEQHAEDTRDLNRAKLERDGWRDVAMGRESERKRLAAQLRNLHEAIGADPDDELATERAIDRVAALRADDGDGQHVIAWLESEKERLTYERDDARGQLVESEEQLREAHQRIALLQEIAACGANGGGDDE